MQPILRDQNPVRRADPFQKPEESRVGPPLSILPPGLGSTVHGPGGGTVEALSKTFGGMYADPAAQAAVKAKPGVYPGVNDLTGKYGNLASGKRSSTQGVVLHRTESPSAASTLSGYDERIKKGSHIGAQYLIDEKGGSNLVTPLDSMVSHSKGFSDSTVGVEVVGPAKKLDRTGAKAPLRDQISALDLSPKMEQRLLGYNDKKLNNVVKWNGDQIYEDISGAQKRSVWNLSNHLAKEYGLDMSSVSQHGADESGANNYTKQTLPDFSAHEHINPKALGEAEPMIEFLQARQRYPELVAQAEKRLETMRASGAAPEEIAKVEALVKKEQDTLGALNLDGNDAEQQALKAEQDAGKPGEASAREHERTDFYDHFYDRIGGLEGAIQ